jgi:hypothetical protein
MTKFLVAETMPTMYKEHGQGKKRGKVVSVLDELSTTP